MRFGIVAANVSLFVGVGLFIAGAQTTAPTSASPVQSQFGGTTVKSKPLDTLSSSDVAVHVARLTGMQEATAVVNAADSVKAQLAVASSDDQVAAKPQIVDGGLKSKKDIKAVTTAAGDTVTALAAKYGVSADTIRNSNGLIGDTIPANREIKISPVNGIVYTVREGDTPDAVASRFRANKEMLVIFNDAELTGAFKVGDTIVIPDGQQPAAPTPPTTTRTRTATTGTALAGFAFGSDPIYGGNGYARGFCTWGVANLIQVPNNWGNASTWAIGARASGWQVSANPSVGAIAQRGGGAGHVGIVTDVSPDGRMYKYKDMNGVAGFGRYGQSDWVATGSTYQNFLTH